MEQLQWQPYGNSDYTFDVFYKCPKCGHKYEKVNSIPWQCTGCKTKLQNVRSLVAKTNQDIRVKHYAGVKL